MILVLAFFVTLGLAAVAGVIFGEEPVAKEEPKTEAVAEVVAEQQFCTPKGVLGRLEKVRTFAVNHVEGEGFSMETQASFTLSNKVAIVCAFEGLGDNGTDGNKAYQPAGNPLVVGKLYNVDTSGKRIL